MSDHDRELRIPDPEDYRMLIECEWADLHHSRSQEWTALGVTTGAHLGILQLIVMSMETTLPIANSIIVIGGAVIGIIFAITGALMTMRHRNVMLVKLSWIFKAEDALGLIEGEDCPKGVIPRRREIPPAPAWNALALPRLFSTSFLIIQFYLLLILLDIAGIVLFS